MRNNRTPAFFFIFIYLISIAGCISGKVEKTSQESQDWPLFLVDSIPQLEAVEIPLDSQVVSETLLEQMGAKHRIRLTDEMVIAFESWSSEGFLNPEQSEKKPFEMIRQFAAYCTRNNKVSLVYNFVNVRYRSCRDFSEKWRNDVIADSECTSLGVFESNIACPLHDLSE